MSARPEVKAGQEWEKRDSARMVTRIRVLEDLSHPQTSRVKVGTVTHDGRVIREREILVSALSNTGGGYRLVKDATATVCGKLSPPGFPNPGMPCSEPAGHDGPHVARDVNGAVLARSQPPAGSSAPLAIIRAVLERNVRNGSRAAESAMPALDVLENALVVLLNKYHWGNEEMKPAGHAAGEWETCPMCLRLIETGKP